MRTRSTIITTALALLLASAASSFAEEAPAGIPPVAIDTFWVLLTGALVFFMNTGFGLLESGLCRAKNAVNILAKNFTVFAVSSLAFWFIGWGLMFGNGSPFFGSEGLLMLTGADNSPATGDAYQGAYSAIAWTGVPLEAKFFFQLVFAGTAATIVSGAVAERVRFLSFIVFSAVLTAILYPVTGHWIWGGGWLAGQGFWDFAGSTVVHSVGGWCALAGILVLGPRLGKYTKDGKIAPITGHNMTSVFTGCFILWLGWFGFNAGSTMTVGNGVDIAHIFVTTNMAAAAGSVTAMLAAWLALGKPDYTMIANGCLAGLVAITAPCAWVSTPAAVLIGGIGGVLVVYAVLFFDKARIDDPVGALSVHLVNGVWGTLCVGLFASPDYSNGAALLENGRMALITAQLTGIVSVAIFTLVASFASWFAIKAIMGIRVSAEEEIEGLDAGEHGLSAYPDFSSTRIGSIHPAMAAASGGAMANSVLAREYRLGEAAQ
ncbi:MAG TPA: ammonium transporter [Candidatus Limnocylindrales bacterium]|nr:ammonium transporter [Candidatus Limnocylindrales bacterium]